MEIFTAISLIKKLITNNTLVNTVTFENSTNIDNDKVNIYPLVNIELLDTIYNPIADVINFEIICIQQKQEYKDLTNNKIDYDSTIDNLNECHQILKTFLKDIEHHSNINIVGSPSINFLYSTGHNGNDGCQLLLSVEVLSNAFC